MWKRLTLPSSTAHAAHVQLHNVVCHTFCTERALHCHNASSAHVRPMQAAFCCSCSSGWWCSTHHPPPNDFDCPLLNCFWPSATHFQYWKPEARTILHKRLQPGFGFGHYNISSFLFSPFQGHTWQGVHMVTETERQGWQISFFQIRKQPLLSSHTPACWRKWLTCS